MAEFNPTPNAQQPGNYTGLSQGIRSSRNNAVGKLFEGLAETLDMGIKEQDRNVQANIRQDIFDEVDSVQGEFGVPDATDLQEDTDEISSRTAPAGVTNAAGQLETLQAAYAQGKLKESHYWARMNSMVRQLRGKYPGYRAEIDTMVSGVTGARPANALRSALMREWDEAAGSTSDFAKLESWATKNGRLPVDYFDRKNSDQPYSETELQSFIARKTRDDAERQSRRAAMAESQDRDSLNTKDVGRNFRVEATQTVTAILQDTTSAAGGTFQKLQTRIRDAQTAAKQGNPLPQAETQELAAMMGQLKQTIRQQLHQTFIQSWDGDPAHSYAAHLSKDDMENTINAAMVPVNVIEQALSSENPWGILGATTAFLESQKTDASRDLLRDMPFAQEMAAMSATLGSDVLSQYITLSPTLQSEIDTSLINYRKLRAASSLASGETVADAFEDGENKERDAGYFNALTSHWTGLVDTIESGDMPLSVVQNNVNYMFGPGSERVLSMLDDPSRFEYFKKVASPAVSRQMMALRDKGDAESWGAYQKYVATTFQSLFLQKVQDLQAEQVRDNVDVDWDKKTKRFTVTADRAGLIPGFGVINDLALATENRRLTNLAEQLNTAISVVNPIVGDAKGDTDREILELLKGMGFDPEAPVEPNMISLLGHALGEALTSDTAKRIAFGVAADPDFDAKEHFGIQLRTGDGN